MRAKDTARLSTDPPAPRRHQAARGRRAPASSPTPTCWRSSTRWSSSAATRSRSSRRASAPTWSRSSRRSCDVLQGYQPQQLTDAEIDALIAEAIAATGAAGAAGMGKVMAELKPKLAGRADMAAVSAQGQGAAALDGSRPRARGRRLAAGDQRARLRVRRSLARELRPSSAHGLAYNRAVPFVARDADGGRPPRAGRRSRRRQIHGPPRPMIPNDFIQTLLVARRHRRSRRSLRAAARRPAPTTSPAVRSIAKRRRRSRSVPPSSSITASAAAPMAPPSAS